jgi:hypothetical protein
MHHPVSERDPALAFVRARFLKTAGLTMRVTKLPVRTRCPGIGGKERPPIFERGDLLQAGFFR